MDRDDGTETQARESAAEWVPLGSLHEWTGNPRVNDKAADKVADSIKRFGWGAPIVARRDGEIIAGHARWKAAHRLGLDRVPVRFVDLDPAEAHLLALADNKLTDVASWNDAALTNIMEGYSLEDVEVAGWDRKELEKLADKQPGFGPLEETGSEAQSLGVTEYSVLIVVCGGEDEQRRVLSKCQELGWECRALI